MATADLNLRMTPSHPGDFLRIDVIDELGLNITKAAHILGVRRATLSALLNARRWTTARWERTVPQIQTPHSILDRALIRSVTPHSPSQARPAARQGRGFRGLREWREWPVRAAGSEPGDRSGRVEGGLGVKQTSCGGGSRASLR